MTTKKLTKLLALYLPYILLGLVATNFGEAWRLAEGKELGDKIMSMMGTVPLAFANPLPSLHPLDLLVGLCCGAGLRLAVYLRGKNAKKYRHGMEYGSARWGPPGTKTCWWWAVPAAARPGFGSSPTFYNVTAPMWLLTRKVRLCLNVDRPC